MRATPPVTIGLPVYNGEDYLDQSLAAIRAQTYTDFEVLIRDNASTDATEEICRDVVAADSRFRYVRNDSNVGGARSSNLILDDVLSPWFMWTYHDDICDPRFVQRSKEVLDAHGNDAVGAIPRVQLIDAAGVVVGRHEDADLDVTSPLPHERLRAVLSRVIAQIQFGLLRTDAVRSAGGVSVSSAGEFILPAGLALRGALPLVPDEALLSIRQHEDRAGGHRESEIAWADPSRPRVPFPYSRSTPLLLQAVSRAGLPAAERRRCRRTVLRYWTLPGWRSIVGDVARLPWDAGWIRR
jgi:GT2 family glycosyltransferase